MRTEQVLLGGAVAVAMAAMFAAAWMAPVSRGGDVVGLGSGIIAGTALVFVIVLAIGEWTRHKELERRRGPAPDERELYLARHLRQSTLHGQGAFHGQGALHGRGLEGKTPGLKKS